MVAVATISPPTPWGGEAIENSRIKQDREVGRRVCKANKYNLVKRVESVVRKEGEAESRLLEQRCCPCLACHPWPLLQGLLGKEGPGLFQTQELPSCENIFLSLSRW